MKVYYDGKRKLYFIIRNNKKKYIEHNKKHY